MKSFLLLWFRLQSLLSNRRCALESYLSDVCISGTWELYLSDVCTSGTWEHLSDVCMSGTWEQCEWCLHEWKLEWFCIMYLHILLWLLYVFLALRMFSKTWRCKLVPQSYPSCDHLGICRTLRIHALNMYWRFIPHSQKAFSSHHVRQVLSRHWYEMA